MYTRYDGRLTFKDLNSNPLLNGVQTSSLRKLWTPQLAFINALGPYQTLVDDISVCTIVLEKTPTFNDLTQSLECKKYDNDTCNILLSRLWVQCLHQCYQSSEGILSGVCLWIWPLLLSFWYPGGPGVHDYHCDNNHHHQVCHMVFALQGFTKEFIALQMDGVGVEYTGRHYILL